MTHSFHDSLILKHLFGDGHLFELLFRGSWWRDAFAVSCHGWTDGLVQKWGEGEVSRTPHGIACEGSVG